MHIFAGKVACWLFFSSSVGEHIFLDRYGAKYAGVNRNIVLNEFLARAFEVTSGGGRIVGQVSVLLVVSCREILKRPLFVRLSSV